MELRITLKCIEIASCIFGVFGSLLIIKIMLRPTFRKMPRHLTCIALATFNFLNLTYILVIDIFEIITGLPAVLMNIILCKLHPPLLTFCNHMDAWLITILTLDRMLAVARPFQINQIVTTFKIKIILIILIPFFFAWDAEMMIRFQYFEDDSSGTNQTDPFCEFSASGDYWNLPDKFFKIKDLIAALLRAPVPIAVILPANIFIIVKILRQKQTRLSMTNTSTMSQNNDDLSKTVWMVVSASLAFVITTSPMSVYASLVMRQKFNSQFQNPTAQILQMMSRINPALNGYLYVWWPIQGRSKKLAWVTCLEVADFLL